MKNFIRRRAHVRAQINVLVACEESQRECIAFRNRGFNAFSCDTLVCSGKHPEWHIHGDVSPYLDGQRNFITQDGKEHQITEWHLIIAHPPCTYLCKMSSVHMVIDGRVQWPRLANMIRARRFFMKCLNAKAPFVAVENPLPMARAQLPKPDCFVHPSWFGVKYTKKTLYWLRNLPPLMATIDYPNARQFVRASRGKYRSRTFAQLADAIAVQWGDFVDEHLDL